jgi:hypothetical protein
VTATPQDVLVAAALPGVNTALAVGNDLYAAEMNLTARTERYENAPVKLRDRCRQQLLKAAARRNAVAGVYAAALEQVRAADLAVAEHVEDAVWRVYLIEGA